MVPILACTVSGAAALALWTRDPGNPRVWPIVGVNVLRRVLGALRDRRSVAPDAEQCALLHAAFRARLDAARPDRVPRAGAGPRPRALPRIHTLLWVLYGALARDARALGLERSRG